MNRNRIDPGNSDRFPALLNTDYELFCVEMMDRRNLKEFASFESNTSPPPRDAWATRLQCSLMMQHNGGAWQLWRRWRQCRATEREAGVASTTLRKASVCSPPRWDFVCSTLYWFIFYVNSLQSIFCSYFLIVLLNKKTVVSAPVIGVT